MNILMALCAIIIGMLVIMLAVIVWPLNANNVAMVTIPLYGVLRFSQIIWRNYYVNLPKKV